MGKGAYRLMADKSDKSDKADKAVKTDGVKEGKQKALGLKVPILYGIYMN